MDNLILYLIIIFTLMIFSFYFVSYREKEDFKAHYKIYQNRQLDIMGDLEKIKYDKYNQVKEFIPDTYNYDIAKDSGIIRSIDNPITFSDSEYLNLGEKIKLKEKQLAEATQANNKSNNVEVKDENEETKAKILEALERETAYPLIRKELDILQIDKILTTLLDKYRYVETQGTNFNNEEIRSYLYSYKLVKQWIVSEISKESEKDEYKIQYINNYGYKYIKDSILSYKVDYRNNLEQYQFIMTLYRDNKEHNFNVYFDVIFDSYNVKYYFKNIVLLGVAYEDSIIFNDFFMTKEPIMDSLKENITDKYLDELDENIIKYLKQSSNDKTNDLREKSFKCFFKDAQTKNECISPSKNNGVGIWDSPCRYDEDCPFYNKNKNYPNTRGGCKDGYCEMPVNVKLFGYKEFSDTADAVCYNCNKTDNCTGIECNMCCEQQKDKKLYPYLNGPDYAFENDFEERISKADYFKKNNISPVKIIV